MLVHRPRLKTQGAVVTAVAMLALGACTDPTARTDLRPEGPPDVLAVLVLDDALGGLVESATFCKLNDEKRPGLVGLPDFTTQQICPEDLGEQSKKIDNAAPAAWYIRVVFDELLDPDVEDLIPVLDENNQETGIFTGTISKTKPVTLQCQDFTGAMVNVEYDGYYSPSGNNVTWPLGPSLVVKPKDPTLISVNSDCQITLVKESIADKSGERVLDAQLGPYPFKIAPIQAISIVPGDGEEIAPEVRGVTVTFNTDVDPASLCNNGDFSSSSTACRTVDPDMTNSKATFSPLLKASEVVTVASFTTYRFRGDLRADAEHTFELPAGTVLVDHCGKSSTLPAPSVRDNTKATFTSSPLNLLSIVPAGGTNIAPNRKIKLDFNQRMTAASIDLLENAGKLTISPEPQGKEFRADFSGDSSIIVVNGQYTLNTEYTLTMKQGLKIFDRYSEQSYVFDEDKTFKFTTAPAIALASSSPASGTTITKGTPTSVVTFSLTFNQEMSPATFVDGVNFSLVNDATGAVIPAAATLSATNPAQILIRSTAPMPAVGSLAAGKYTFTFKKDKMVTDKITPTPNTYLQTTDRVIKITVAEAESSPDIKCLGAP